MDQAANRTTNPAPKSVVQDTRASKEAQHIPFSLQYRTMTTLQSALEKCCFAYAQRKIPRVLELNGWDCAERVELAKWPWLFKSNARMMPDTTAEWPRNRVERLLQVLQDINTCVFDRKPVSAETLSGFIGEAIDLAKLLGDVPCAEGLAQFQVATGSIFLELMGKKREAAAHVDAKLQSIASEKERLDNAAAGIHEQKAALHKHWEDQAQTKLQQALDKFKPASTTAATQDRAPTVPATTVPAPTIKASANPAPAIGNLNNTVTARNLAPDLPVTTTTQVPAPTTGSLNYPLDAHNFGLGSPMSMLSRTGAEHLDTTRQFQQTQQQQTLRAMRHRHDLNHGYPNMP